MKKRIVWMDVMRLICAFLVIVNHTNSPIYQMTTPANGSLASKVSSYTMGT